MTEKPILFSGSMVRAILEGRKTVTRRVIKPQPSSGIRQSPLYPSGIEDGHGREMCWKYRPRDRLWVRETWQTGEYAGNEPCGPVYRATDPEWGTECVGWQWRPSIFMPRWASRITLEVTDVRAEKLHSITEEDAMAEGVYHRCDFKALWDKINGVKYPWASNCYVWRIEFKRVE